MVYDSWTTIAVPILLKLADSELSDFQRASSEILSDCNGNDAFLRTLAALIEDGYITGGTVYWPLGAGKPVISIDVLRLTPKGRRAIHQWPPEQTVELLVDIIEREIQSLPDGESRSKLQSLQSAIRAVGTDVLAG